MSIWQVMIIVQWILLVMGGVFLAGILRYLGAVQERIELVAPHVTKYELGDRLDDVTLKEFGGDEISLRTVVGGGDKSALLLVSPGCGSCNTLLLQVDELARRRTGLPQGWNVAVVFMGDVEGARTAIADKPGLTRSGVTTLLDDQDQVRRSYSVRHTPVGLVVDGDSRVLSQSLTPYTNWLYKVLDVLPPDQALVDPDSGGWEPVRMTPEMEGYVGR